MGPGTIVRKSKTDWRQTTISIQQELIHRGLSPISEAG